MSRAQQEEQLLGKLRTSLGSGPDGFTALSDWPSGVLILNKGHYRGVWHWSEGVFSFTPGGYGTPTFSAMNAQDAVRYTLEHVCRQ